MNKHKRTAVGALVAFTLAGGVLFAQSTDAPADPPIARLTMEEVKLETAALSGDIVAQIKAQTALTDFLTEAPGNPEMVRAVVLRSLSQLADGKGGAKSAAQVSQAADEAALRLQLLQVQQNQRIISLLEQIVKKK